MPPSFPLFRLPRLAFLEVIEQFGLAETFFMSLCSKRTNHLMKNHQNKSDGITISVSMHGLTISPKRAGQLEDLVFDIKESSNVRPPSFESCMNVTEEKGRYYERIHIDLNWNDWFDGLKMIISHVTELFEKPISSVSLYDEKHPERVKKLSDFIASRQNTVEELTCQLQRMTDKQINHILNDCITTERFNLGHYTEENRIFFPRYKLECVTVNGDDVELTLEHLKSIDCHFLFVYTAKISMKAVNGFLKHWINGGSSRIEWISTFMQGFDLAVLFDGIEMVERDQEVVRTYNFPKGFGGDKNTLYGGFDITRNDGKAATIRHLDNIPEYFEMIVWN